MSSRRVAGQARFAPDALDRLLLRLGSEKPDRGEVLEAARELAFTDAEVRDRIETLVDREWVRLEDARLLTTPEGRDRLRSLGATAQFNIRPPARVLAELRSLSRAGESPTALAVRALEEWVRMERFPGIDFRWTPSGRQPHVTGTGLTVWETFRVWLEHGESTAAMLAHHPHLRAAQIEGAVRYAREYQDEMTPGWGAKPSFARPLEV